MVWRAGGWWATAEGVAIELVWSRVAGVVSATNRYYDSFQTPRQAGAANGEVRRRGKLGGRVKKQHTHVWDTDKVGMFHTSLPGEPGATGRQ